ncbi:MAG: IspD/TarI family cytidylyltransferase [Bacteroidaceae bacterium]
MSKNIAIIIAGGSGARMQQDIPKQFLNVFDKPVILYTLEAFQNHPEIDAIEVVCIDGWHEILRAYCKQFNITKLENIVSGGKTGQESIRNGLFDVHSRYDDDDIVLIHDSIRPMVSEAIISDCIKVCREHGNAITVIPCAEAMLTTTDGACAEDQYKRDNLKRTQTPQAFHIGDLVSAHEEAAAKGITNSIASCTLFVELGRKVWFSAGSEKNVKLTTPEDIEIFKALLTCKKESWFK